MKTIMVVDDDERMRRILWEMLRKRGFHVIKARDAVDAHHLLTEGGLVDLVLLDINMPEVSGDTFNEVIQSFHFKTPVIVCSVLPIEEQIRRIPDARDYYDKSESFDVLIDKIDTAFNLDRPDKAILIMDDDPDIRSLYCQLLAKAGYAALEAGDHPEIADFLQKQIDLILLDVAMPRISDLEFYATMRKAYPHAKVIVLSMFSEDRQKVPAFKADDYFHKTQESNVLLEKIKRLL
ncbi:MAG: response regulator [Candidatus Omnitrophica bacterium]|nr:response regulator [Candidatus Omnitrophota bacterium]